jgi:quercetin dioxygenase-like cupin family protein
MNRRDVSRFLLRAATVSALLVMGCANSAENAKPVLPQDLVWFSPPGNAAVQGAWALGAENKPGPYLFRVKLAHGARIPPHTHPDERNSTVLAGTIYVGFGEVFDEAKVVAIPPGGVYVAPANVPHYVWAKDGEAEYQEAGVGPTATVPVKR